MPAVLRYLILAVAVFLFLYVYFKFGTKKVYFDALGNQVEPIKCPECSKEVNSAEEYCPYCGCNLKQK